MVKELVRFEGGDSPLPYGNTTDLHARTVAQLLTAAGHAMTQSHGIDIANTSLQDLYKMDAIAKIQLAQGIAPANSPEQLERWAQFILKNSGELTALSTRAATQLQEAVRLYDEQRQTARNRTQKSIVESETALREAEEQHERKLHETRVARRARRRELRRPIVRWIFWGGTALVGISKIIVRYGPAENPLRPFFAVFAGIWDVTYGALIEGIIGFVQNIPALF
jgi:hypothetical protein